MNSRLDLHRIDYLERVRRAREALDSVSLDALVVGTDDNLRWLLGTDSPTAAVITQDDVLVSVDPRYSERAVEEFARSGIDPRLEAGLRGLSVAASSSLRRNARVGFSPTKTTVADYQILVSCFKGRVLVDLEGPLEQLRLVKDSAEIQRIELACSIADRAYADITSDWSGELSELSIANRLEFSMVRMGADDRSFKTIVAGGPRSSHPHAQPSKRHRVDPLLPTVIDFGALVDGYHSDCTRTYWLGDLDDERRRVYDAVAEAQLLGLASVRPGVSVEEVDRACRSSLERSGLAKYFVHPTGHHIGTSIHEKPYLGPGFEGTLEPGNVVTIEPGVYIPGFVGVRIEDTVLVTPEGHRRLTLSPRIS